MSCHLHDPAASPRVTLPIPVNTKLCGQHRRSERGDGSIPCSPARNLFTRRVADQRRVS